MDLLLLYIRAGSKRSTIMKKNILLTATLGAVAVLPASAASLIAGFQSAIASEQHPDFGGEARFYHVSVNATNAGIGSFASTTSGTNNPAGVITHAFTEDVVGYGWVGGTNNVPNQNTTGGDSGRIVFTTTDTSFDGFGQNQLKLWTTTDPGPAFATVGTPFDAVADVNGNSHRSFGGAISTVDISGLATGSVYAFYGAFNATPSLSAVMRDTDGIAPDIILADAHTNGDASNRTEYYASQLSFVNDLGYDEIVYTWDSDGDGDLATGNGRGVGTLLTGTATGIPEPSSLALLGLSGLGVLLGRRRK
jgi:hypothetical protein